MAVFVFSNDFQTTLADAATSTQTTLTFSTTIGIPTTIPAGYYWEITLNDVATGNIREICYGTANLGGGQVQVLRGQENTTAVAWNVNDKAYSCASAGVLASFANAGNLTGFVELSPPSVQTGSINITGSVTATGAPSAFAGVNVNGPLYGATTGAFSGGVSVYSLQTDQGYGNIPVAQLPFLYAGSAGSVGMGASSGLSVEGVTASLFGIGRVGGSPLFVIDTSGNAGIADNCYVGGTMSANEVLQNSVQVLDNLTSSGTITITGSGATRNLEVATGGQIPIGGMLFQIGNSNSASQALPSYGTWGVEVLWTFGVNSNTNGEQTIFFNSGTVTEYVNSGTGYGSSNASYYSCAMWAALANGNQTLTWSLTSSVGLEASAWTIKSIRLS